MLLTVCITVLSLISGKGLAIFSVQLESWVASLVLLAMLLPMSLVLDILIYGATGTTLGRWLLNIRLYDADGNRLSFVGYAYRTLRFWLFGLGAGIAPIAAFTAFNELGWMARGFPARYDDAHGICVDCKPVTRFGLASFAASAVVLLLCSWLLVNDEQTLQPHWKPVPPGFAWTNPYTQLTTDIPRGWTLTIEGASNGSPVFVFDHISERLSYMLSSERVPGITLGGYVGHVLSTHQDNVAFNETALAPVDMLDSAWTGRGQSIANPDMEITIQVHQERDVYWRLTELRHDDAPATLQGLSDVLLATTSGR